MIRFMKQKLLHKKWMVVCLLIGNILLVAIASSNPMYRNAALQKTLTSKYASYILEENEYPGVMTLESNLRNGNKNSGKSFERMENLSKELADELGVTEKEVVSFYSTAKTRGLSTMNRQDNKGSITMRICALSNMKEHAKMLTGKMCSSKPDASGAYEAVISQRALTKLNLLVGEEVSFAGLLGADKQPIRLKIVGVFENSEEEDPYWISSPSEYFMECFIDSELFRSVFINTKQPVFTITGNFSLIYDYEKVKSTSVNHIVEKTEEIMNENNTREAYAKEPGYLAVLKDYQLTAKKVSTTLLILQIPVLALLLAFIFMISRQMLDLEQNEIAMLKSRGSSKKQIILIYLLQSTVISVMSFLVGLPIGIFLCKALGSTNGFLEFIQRKAIDISVNGEVFLYCLGAMAISIAFMVFPVFKDANVTIVNYKQKKNRKSKSLLQRAYVDVILLGISLYGLYSFTDRKEALTAQMLQGASLDPFLFICSSLFIISASLVALRIQPLMVKLVYMIGKKRWKPAFFASFLQIIRTKGKQSFMMVFLMLTVALGIFNATVARTILSNSEKGIRYSAGTDLILKQAWEDNALYREQNPDLELSYVEPDFSVYESMEGVEKATKVYKEEKITANLKSNNVSGTIMGIDTKNFGETIKFQDDLLPIHINNYLNAISQNSDAILLSTNYKEKYDVEIGDKLTFTGEDKKQISGVVYGFVDYWPGYAPVSYVLNDKGVMNKQDNYLIVANLTKVQTTLGIKPYEVWIKTKGSSQFIYDYAKKNNLEYTKFEDVASELVDVRNDALFQGTNGILTMSFIVILILCSTGFLIYWILSIRQRELLFGVFRAMGMTKKEIIHMLINEQVFSSGLSIIIGTILGLLASKLFVPLVQIFYSSTEQTIPLEVVRNTMDMVRLFCVIGIVIIICMAVLGKLISKIRISQALKLGEE